MCLCLFFRIIIQCFFLILVFDTNDTFTINYVYDKKNYKKNTNEVFGKEKKRKKRKKNNIFITNTTSCIKLLLELQKIGC